MLIYQNTTNAFIEDVRGNMIAEIISQMKTISEYTQNTIEIYTYVTIIFIVINICLIQFMNFLEKRLSIPGLIAGDK